MRLSVSGDIRSAMMDVTTRGAMMLKRATFSIIAIALILVNLAIPAWAANEAAVKAAIKAADAWLRIVDSGDYRHSWEQASSFFKQRVPEQVWEQQAAQVRGPLGNVVTRKVKHAVYTTSLPGVPDGQYVVIQYDTSFQNKKSAIETMTPMLDTDGQWRVSGYYIK
jgi:hypothetical protein